MLFGGRGGRTGGEGVFRYYDQRIIYIRAMPLLPLLCLRHRASKRYGAWRDATGRPLPPRRTATERIGSCIFGCNGRQAVIKRHVLARAEAMGAQRCNSSSRHPSRGGLLVCVFGSRNPSKHVLIAALNRRPRCCDGKTSWMLVWPPCRRDSVAV